MFKAEAGYYLPKHFIMRNALVLSVLACALLLPQGSAHALSLQDLEDLFNDAERTATAALLHPVFAAKGTLQALENREWLPGNEKVTVYNEYIEVSFELDSKAREFFAQTIAGTGTRMPLALEVDLKPDTRGTLSPLLKVERVGVPGEAWVMADTSFGDSNPGYGALIREPQHLEKGTRYALRFYPTGGNTVLQEGGKIALALQVSVDLRRLSQVLPQDLAIGKTAELLEVAKLYFDRYTDERFNYFVVSAKGFEHKPLKAEAPESGGSSTPSTPPPAIPASFPPPPSKKLPDLVAKRAWLTNEAETEEKTKFFRTEKLKMKAQFANTGDANPDEDMEVRFYLSKGTTEDSHSEWKRVGTDNIKRENLKVGDTKTETEGLELWKDVPGPGVYNVVACIDRTKDKDNGDGKITEKHKSNNCSKEAVFEVIEATVAPPPPPDLLISAIGIGGGKTSVKKGEKFSPAMRVQNVGGNLTAAIRSAYYLLGPSTGNSWAYLDSDESTPGDLPAGKDVREEIKSGIKIKVKGTYRLKACADYLNQATESNEGNNCAESGSFTVK